MIKPSDLAVAGYQLVNDKGRLGKVFHGNGLIIDLSDKSIKIKKMGISCAILHTAVYSMEKLNALVYGLSAE